MARRLIEADEAFWKRGEEDPAFVNAQIAAWRRELTPERLPRQNKVATGYGSDASGRLVRLPVPPERRLTDTPLHRQDYAELRSDVLRLAQHGQRLGAALVGPLAALERSLPEDLAASETVSLWRDFHRVSGALAKHEIAQRSKDFSQDRLDEACVVDLRGVVSAGNIVVLGDPKLLALSESTRPTQLRADFLEEGELAAPLVAALGNEPLIAHEDVRDDAEANAAAIAEGEDNPIDAKVAEVATKAQRNVFAALITSARSSPRPNRV